MTDRHVHHHHHAGGIGLGGCLLVLFVALKLTGSIAWSWLWVLSPIWIPLGALVGCALILGVAFLIAWGIDRVRGAA